MKSEMYLLIEERNLHVSTRNATLGENESRKKSPGEAVV